MLFVTVRIPLDLITSVWCSLHGPSLSVAHESCGGSPGWIAETARAFTSWLRPKLLPKSVRTDFMSLTSRFVASPAYVFWTQLVSEAAAHAGMSPTPPQASFKRAYFVTWTLQGEPHADVLRSRAAASAAASAAF